MQSLEREIPEEHLSWYEERKNIYQFLHLLYSQPLSNGHFLTIKRQDNFKVFNNLGKGGTLLYDFFSNQHEANLKNEQQEFNKLFVGPGTLLAPPWESVYRGRDRILHDFPALEMSQLYDRFGIELIRDNIEAEDHLVLELEFMIYLIENSFTKGKVNDSFLDGQNLMLLKHFSKWIPDFSSDVIKHTESKLYKGAALLLYEFIMFDNQYIQELCSDKA